MKTLFNLLITVFLLLLISGCKDDETLSQDVTVDIPDTNFLNALIENGVDINLDGVITESEAGDIFELNIAGKEILDLTGIEKFYNLTNLDCSYNYLNKLDLAKNKNLGLLKCAGNALNKNLDVSNCLRLGYLDCSHGTIEELDLTNNNQLRYLQCHSNKLNTIDLSNNQELTILYIFDNPLYELDITNNQKLKELNFSGWFSNIDLSKNTQLEDFVLRDSWEIYTLDLSKNTSLKRIAFYDTFLLTQVCVWTEDFPPTNLSLEISYSDPPPYGFPQGNPSNIVFTTECN